MTSLYEQYQVYLQTLDEDNNDSIKYIHNEPGLIIYHPKISQDLGLHGINIKDNSLLVEIFADYLVILINGVPYFFYTKRPEIFVGKGNPIRDLTPVSSFEFAEKHKNAIPYLKPWLKTAEHKIWFEIMEPNMIQSRGLAFDHKDIKQLPDNLTVEGNLDLEDCKQIQELPKGLKVSGNLYLLNSGIKEIPEGTQVGGKIHADQNVKIPADLQSQTIAY